MHTRHSAIPLAAWLLIAAPANTAAAVIPLDDTHFMATPPERVVFNADGSATLTEDAAFGSTLLTHAPPNQPEVIAALPGTMLSFHYDLVLGASDSGDILVAGLLESGVATLIEQIVDQPGRGILTFDLDALGLTGVTELGIELALLSGDLVYGSSVTIADLQTRIPLPPTPLLAAAGLLAIYGGRGPRRGIDSAAHPMPGVSPRRRRS